MMGGYIYFPASDSDVYDLAVRLGRADQLGGYFGIKRLCEFYRELSAQIGEPIEVDIVAWCCDWAYYDSLDAAEADGHNLSALEDEGLDVLEVYNEHGEVVGYLVPVL